MGESSGTRWRPIDTGQRRRSADNTSANASRILGRCGILSYIEAISARERLIIAVLGPSTRDPRTREDGPPLSSPAWKPPAVPSHEAVSVMPKVVTETLFIYLCVLVNGLVMTEYTNEDSHRACMSMARLHRLHRLRLQGRQVSGHVPLPSPLACSNPTRSHYLASSSFSPTA